MWFAWLHKNADDEGLVWSMCNLKLEKKKHFKRFEGRGIFYAKLLNEGVVRAKGTFVFLHYFLSFLVINLK